MSIAERTREAVRDRPFLYEALRAGVVNSTAAARLLDVGDEEAVAAALRRYAAELAERDDRTPPDDDPPAGEIRVTMHSGFRETSPADDDTMLAVGSTGFAPREGSLTAVLARGGMASASLRHILGRCHTTDIEVTAAGVAGDALVVVVDRRDGPHLVQLVENVFERG